MADVIICPVCEEAPRSLRGRLRAMTLQLVIEDNNRLRAALRDVVNEHLHRCEECDTPASWVEATFSGRDKYWCDEHVVWVQKAISKGAGRYQPQGLREPAWLVLAQKALASQLPGEDKP